MAHRHERLCSASQLWLPHPALCVVLPECFRGLCVWSGAMGSKSGKLWNIADRDTKWLAWAQASRCSLGGGHGLLVRNDQQGLCCQVWSWVHGFRTLGSVPLLSCCPDTGW